MTAMIRAAALRGFTPLVDGLGGDGAALLGRFRVPADAGDADPPDGDVLIRADTAARVLETAAETLGCPDLGLRLAERQGTEILGPLAVALENSATLGEALDVASRWLFVHSPALRIARVEDPESVHGVIGLLYDGGDGRAAPQSADLGTGVFHRIIALLAGRSPNGAGYGLRSVHLPHPPLAPGARYREFFGADVRFDRPSAVLRVPADLASRPLTGGDETVRALAIGYLETHFDRPDRTVTDRVRAALARSLGSGPVRIGSVARLLRMHPRTLQRHLAAEDTTFEGVLDDVRRDAAHRLITRTDLPFSQVTAMVGLAEQSALSRASRRWFGMSPRGLRQTTNQG